MAGIATGLSTELALGFLVLAIALYAFARSGVQSEIIVAIYWFTFCIFATIYASVSISGFYFPFYAAFLLTIAGGLIGTGLRILPSFILAAAGFIVVTVAALLGYTGADTFEVFQRLLAYTFGVIILLQFRSTRGLQPVLIATGAASLVVSGWVIWTASQTGFAYRAGLDVNQNVVTLFVGLGLVTVFCVTLESLTSRRRVVWTPLLLISVAIMAYAVLLLASRGMTVALVAAAAAVLIRAVNRDRRMLYALVPLVAVVSLGFLLPGGQGIVERMSEGGVETGNERLPIWEATLDAFAAGNIRELILGHGFDSSRAVVQQRFGSLTSTHNTYLQILYEFGIIGLALFSFMHIDLLARSRHVRGAHGLIMIGLLTFLLTTNLAMSASDGFMYWTTVGVIAAIATWAPVAPTHARPRA